MGAKAYAETMRSIEDPKVSEAKIFTAVTRGLERHAGEGRKSENLKEYLAKNQKLWVAVKNMVSTTDNGLPEKLRGDLASIAIWVDKHTSSVLTGEGEVSDLISVNQSVMNGLMGKTEVPASAQNPS